MTKRARSALLIAICLALSSCGGRVSTSLGPNTAVAQSIALPSPVAAIPVFAVKVPDGASDGTIARISHIGGVAVAAGVRIHKETVRSPEGSAQLRVAAVDPLDFRPLALPSARDAPFVWTALLSNQAVISYDAAHRLKIAGGEPVRLKNGPSQLIGAFADTGVPNIADLLVSQHVGGEAGLRKTNLVEVGAKPGASVDEIAKGIHQVFPGAVLHRLIAQPPPVLQPDNPQPFGVAQGSIIGTMHYLIQKNGFIKPDPAWVN
ncbi:MAG: ABC transporter permease, partial [Actinomycetota bacterium]